jgi:hypothetical protein
MSGQNLINLKILSCETYHFTYTIIISNAYDLMLSNKFHWPNLCVVADIHVYPFVYLFKSLYTCKKLIKHP